MVGSFMVGSGTGPLLGAAGTFAEGGGGGGVATEFFEEGQVRERFHVMGVEIDRLAIAVGGGPGIALGVADDAEQAERFGGFGVILEPGLAVAGGFVELPPVRKPPGQVEPA